MRYRQISTTTITALALLTCAAVVPSYAQFNVLYDFGSNSGDPTQPSYSGIVAEGPDGNLYTTAPQGGSSGEGAVFRITTSGAVTVLHGFGGSDGSGPQGGLTLSNDGTTLYGTTCSGGKSGAGTVFTITPAGNFSVLYSFTGGSDGQCPYAPPVEGTDGNFYGTTSGGGKGYGVVYRITPAGTLTPLYQFDLTHGLQPFAPLVQGLDGNFYGTTASGGNNGSDAGVIFKITPTGRLTVIYNFDGLAHGGLPFGPLVQGVDGQFYGTTLSSTGPTGVVFKISSSGVYTVLHTMNGSSDGESPYGGLVQASDGNFYGVNSAGGSHGLGTIFKITPKGAYSVLYNFDGVTGSTPEVTVTQHTNSILYGDTKLGGTGGISPCTAGNCGVLYKLNETLHPFLRLLRPTGKVGSQTGILGQGFDATSVVRFNGVKATQFTLVSPNFILATVPAGASDGYVMVTTGATTLTSTQKYIVHNSWGRGAAMPTPVRYPAGVGAINGKIYVVGGITTGGTFIATNQVYDTATNLWTTAAPLPAAVGDGAGAVVNGILYVIGGSISLTQVVNTVYAYNPSTDTWTSKVPMLTARGSIGSAVEKGLIYVVGGVNGDGHTRLDNVESYNPATNSWTEEAPLLVGKSEVSVGLLGSTIIAADGYTTSADTGDNEGYSASSNSWKSLASDPTPRHDSCYGVIGTFMYIAGGGLSPIATNESYSISSNKWKTLSPISVATTAPGSAVWNGQLYCFGGGDSTGGSGGNYFNNVQIYQP